jgi:hypothetical protein
MCGKLTGSRFLSCQVQRNISQTVIRHAQLRSDQPVLYQDNNLVDQFVLSFCIEGGFEI